MITKFFSNKNNLIGLQFICSFILSYVFWQISNSIGQVLILYGVVVLMNFSSYLYGMSKGMVHMYDRTQFFINLIEKAKKMKHTDKDGK